MELQKKETLQIFLTLEEQMTKEFDLNLDLQGYNLKTINFASSNSDFDRIHIYEKNVEVDQNIIDIINIK